MTKSLSDQLSWPTRERIKTAIVAAGARVHSIARSAYGHITSMACNTYDNISNMSPNEKLFLAAAVITGPIAVYNFGHNVSTHSGYTSAQIANELTAISSSAMYLMSKDNHRHAPTSVGSLDSSVTQDPHIAVMTDTGWD